MATANGKTDFVQHGVVQSVWALGNADTGTPEQLSRYPFHSVTIAGTFGGATVLLEGSDDGTNYFTLTAESPTPAVGAGDVQITTTAAGRWDFQNVPQHIRPKSSGGTGTAVTV